MPLIRQHDSHHLSTPGEHLVDIYQIRISAVTRSADKREKPRILKGVLANGTGAIYLQAAAASDASAPAARMCNAYAPLLTLNAKNPPSGSSQFEFVGRG
ncbi:Hypothetical protein NTJ_06785 [Nesidiocoris tenuis]|uniref:Uncharacterized protein n=1 Tax=Nesidiocoris tenuis TaxID=355587 RepID=A0ABN7ASR1_9HEMI|nr:Hypothetical protein NTJ_06785 [Nesidiocoris tenuis]